MTADPSKSPRLNTPNPANYSSPSVPISVYKQLAGELNVAKNEMAALKSENQQLRSNNQQLQGQVHQVVQAAEHLKQMVSRYDFGAEFYQVVTTESQAPLARRQPASFELTPPAHPELLSPQPSAPEQSHMPPQPVAETQQRPQSPRKPKPTKMATMPPPNLSNGDEAEGSVNGWVILVAAIAIILTAFGAGYMVVLPLLNNNHSTTR